MDDPRRTTSPGTSGKTANLADGNMKPAQNPRIDREPFEPIYTLDHVQLAMPTGEEDRARAFYVDVLGFEEIPKPEELAKRGGAWFRCGSAAIHLGVDAAFVPAKKAHPALRSANYRRLLERLARHGVSIAPDALPLDGKAHAYIEDPFGNRIELIEA
jgi:catechol 2,3-dioxygenase-like lactoylglutathione lyase family enzyme